MKRILLLAVLAAGPLAGCAHPYTPRMAPAAASPCRTSSVRWYAPDDAATRTRLDAWCAGVGEAELWNASGPPTAPVALSDLTFVSWNVHVGRADIQGFVRDLRAGRLTNGRETPHFVLLLQEALRTEAVPALVPPAKGARRIGGAPSDADIGAMARALGLSLIYAPSMRNGARADDPPADRGSAILSTLPLDGATAVELPFGRQRRVAVLADVLLSDRERLPVGVIHFDALNPPRRLWIFGTRAWRATQANALVALLPRGSFVLGADLNTWLGEQEAAPRSLRQLSAATPVVADPSSSRGRVLDYMFFRGPGPATARYLVVANKYGSDHHPLIGWIDSSTVGESADHQ